MNVSVTPYRMPRELTSPYLFGSWVNHTTRERRGGIQSWRYRLGPRLYSSRMDNDPRPRVLLLRLAQVRVSQVHSREVPLTIVQEEKRAYYDLSEHDNAGNRIFPGNDRMLDPISGASDFVPLPSGSSGASR